jgi:hypothetical protein
MKTFLVLALIVVIAAAIYYLLAFRNGYAPAAVPYIPTANAPTNNAVSATAENSTPDAIVSMLLQPNSSTDVAPVESDLSLMASNDSAINGFDQSLDATQF